MGAETTVSAHQSSFLQGEHTSGRPVGDPRVHLRGGHPQLALQKEVEASPDASLEKRAWRLAQDPLAMQVVGGRSLRVAALAGTPASVPSGRADAKARQVGRLEHR